MFEKKTVIIMVGLPARGKTFLSIRLKRYLEWQGFRVRIFNAGSYRRAVLGADSSRSDFFDTRVTAFAMERERIAKKCFSDLTEWLKAEGDAVIYDATNVTASRREYLRGECIANDFDSIFVENICDDPDILTKIVKVKITNSVDYSGSDMGLASRDFGERIMHYERVYETVGDDLPCIKIYNFGEKVKRRFDPTHRMFDEIADFLGSINLVEKNVYITRHGETYFNLEDRIGGDSSLTQKGKEYAGRLSGYFRGRDFVIISSRKRRTIETASFFDCEKLAIEELNEIDSGVCDGMSYREVSVRHPEIYNGRKADKFNFRYPKGESYRDLIQRVKLALPVIEAQKKDVLVIAHRAVNRCLFSYFSPTPQEDIPYLDMPLNKVIRIFNRKALYDYEDITV